MTNTRFKITELSKGGANEALQKFRNRKESEAGIWKIIIEDVASKLDFDRRIKSDMWNPGDQGQSRAITSDEQRGSVWNKEGSWGSLTDIGYTERGEALERKLISLWTSSVTDAYEKYPGNISRRHPLQTWKVVGTEWPSSRATKFSKCKYRMPRWTWDK